MKTNYIFTGFCMLIIIVFIHLCIIMPVDDSMHEEMHTYAVEIEYGNGEIEILEVKGDKPPYLRAGCIAMNGEHIRCTIKKIVSIHENAHGVLIPINSQYHEQH